MSDPQTENSDNNDARLERIMNSMFLITTGQKAEPLEVSTREDVIDAISLAINTLVEEIQYSEKKVEYLEEINRITEEKKLLASIIESSDDAIMSKSIDGTISSWNNGAKNIYGFSKEEIANTDYRSLISEDSIDEYDNLLVEIKQGKSFKGYETKRITKSGETLTMSISYSPIYNVSGEIVGVSSIERDISEKKKQEEKLLSYSEAIEKSYKELDQFAYITVHDLKGPLNNIHSLSTILSNQIEVVNTAALKSLDMIDSSVNTAKKRIEDLTEIIKAQIQETDASRESVSFNDVLDEVLAGLESQINDKNATILKSFDELPEIKYPRHILKSVFHNLVSNGIKYSSKNREPEISIESGVTNGRAYICVCDNGLGMNLDEERNTLFQSITRLHDHVEGSGIGLYLLKKSLDNVGSNISVKSEIDVGTEFKIEF